MKTAMELPDQWGIVPGGGYWIHSLIPSFGGTVLNEDLSESNLLSPGHWPDCSTIVT